MKFLVVVLAGLALLGCSPPAQSVAEAPAEKAAPVATAPISSEGTITALSENTVTLNHEPIEAIGWGAMNMRFDAAPDLLTGLAVGDRVRFDLESAARPNVIIRIEKTR